jgi:hypothetical protein
MMLTRCFVGLGKGYTHPRLLRSQSIFNEISEVDQLTFFRSNDYSSNECKSPLKAILLNKVVVGKGCKMLQDNTTLTAPPPGFDSVIIASFLTVVGLLILDLTS